MVFFSYTTGRNLSLCLERNEIFISRIIAIPNDIYLHLFGFSSFSSQVNTFLFTRFDVYFRWVHRKPQHAAILSIFATAAIAYETNAQRRRNEK